ncbi:alkaline phosphatase family protein [Patescibacteria group bacterium]
MKLNKVLVIGLDGATFDLIKPWVKNGKLPVFKKLMESGSWGELESTTPPLTPPAWTSAFSGVNPGKHGIFDFFNWEGYQRTPVLSTDIKRPMIWEILGKNKLKTVALNVPITYPPQKIKGVVVSGMQTPDLESEFATPKRWQKILKDMDYVIDYGDKGEVVSEKGTYLKKTLQVIEKREKAALKLMEKEDWNLFIAVFTTLDRIQHFFWQDKSKILKIYQRLEKAIDKLTEAAGENVPLVIFSDHGFGPLKKDVYLNNFLKDEGLLTVKSTHEIFQKLGLTQKNMTDLANLMTKIGLGSLVGQLSKSVGDQVSDLVGVGNVDWSKTKAWFASFAGQSVKLNLKGREPEGVVKKEDLQKTKKRIAEKIADLKDPGSKKKIVKKVHFREDIYHGPYLEKAPDMVVEAQPGYVFQEGFGEKLVMTARQGRAKRTADHHREGIFLAAGQGINNGQEIKGLKVADIAPTLLYLFNLPLSPNFDGKVTHKMFTKKSQFQRLGFEEKVELTKSILRKAMKKYPKGKIILNWTGGKDSTIILWLLREVCFEENIPLPRMLFVNEGHVFKSVVRFVEKLTKEYGFQVDFQQNDDVLKQVKKVGDPVWVKKLNQRNQKEIKRLGYKGEKFPFEPESYVGNHLMKTVAMNLYYEKHNLKAVITGIRWDEQEARADETFFSARRNPSHTRVHPILHLDEREVWEVTFNRKIPYVKLYKDGYRSLGAKGTTTKTTDIPAWEQDLEKTTERIGRRQDKEKIMARLRKLGYM